MPYHNRPGEGQSMLTETSLYLAAKKECLIYTIYDIVVVVVNININIIVLLILILFYYYYIIITILTTHIY